jgi:hypothetical protein
VNPRVVAAVLARSKGLCEWCAAGHGLELHHVDPKGMGGRRRTKEESDSPGNLLQLCRVCHGAAHRETVILPSGHSCGRCYLRETCAWSRSPGEGRLRNHTPLGWPA